MLSNITDGRDALLQTILLGQPQLRRTLANPNFDQLRQRVLASYHLGGLSRNETYAYIKHRLRAVGWNGRPSWEEDALDLVHRHSGGIPRRINRLCSRILLGGALEGTDRLTAPLVEATAKELEDDLGAGSDAAPQASSSRTSDPDTAAALDDVMHRLEALERQMQRRERALNALIDFLTNTGGGRR